MRLCATLNDCREGGPGAEDKEWNPEHRGPFSRTLGDGKCTLLWTWMTARSDKNYADMIESEYFIFIFC